MTTTSPLPFSMMDIPLIDDNMEMASPYQGHADDFDIDIDAMEDQVSNPDRDMTVADEYMDNPPGTNNEQDGSPDEDMVDDEAEPSMIDAEEYETNPDTGVHYVEEKTYEAEMAEDDFDEDIDAPVPDPEGEAPASLDHTDTQEVPQPSTEGKNLKNGSQSPNVLYPEIETQTADKEVAESQADSEQTAHHLNGQRPLLESDRTHVEPEVIGKVEEVDLTAQEIDVKGKLNTELDDSNEHQQLPVDWQDPESKEGDQDQPLIEEPKQPDAILHEKQKVPATEQHNEQEHGSTDHTSLYSVKVYYQENEISLFPPREGDPSETYFLEDERLAYEGFGKLFEACRGVLQSHIHENELLVIDIEALNLQLTEDSFDTNKITLKQIVDVYLELCHNDGIQEPEALYLSLTTRSTLAAELSGLLLAVSEGKGLSEIQSWDLYPEAEGVSTEYEETAYEETYEESYLEGDQEASDGAGDGNQNQHLDGAATPQDHATSILGTEDVSAKHKEATDDVNQPTDENGDNFSAASPDQEQKTESTVTVEALPQDDVFEERLEPGEVEEYYDDENHEAEYNDEVEAGDEVHLEEEPLIQAGEVNVTPDKPGGDDVKNHTEDLPEDDHGRESDRYEQSTLEANEKAIADELQIQDNSNATENLVEEASTSTIINEIPPLVDDSLDTAEESAENPGGHSDNDSSEPGEINEPAEQATLSPSYNNEAAELPFDEDDDYLALGIVDDLDNFEEDHDNASTSQISAKRSREVDDEYDLPESTTPEVKRSRSS